MPEIGPQTLKKKSQRCPKLSCTCSWGKLYPEGMWKYGKLVRGTQGATELYWCHKVLASEDSTFHRGNCLGKPLHLRIGRTRPHRVQGIWGLWAVVELWARSIKALSLSFFTNKMGCPQWMGLSETTYLAGIGSTMPGGLLSNGDSIPAPGSWSNSWVWEVWVSGLLFTAHCGSFSRC